MKYNKWQGHAKELLCNYTQNRDYLLNMRRDIMYSQQISGAVIRRGSGIGDPTYAKTEQLSHNRLIEMEREVTAVETLLRLLDSGCSDDDNKRELLKMVYFFGTHTLYGVAAVLAVSETTVKRWNSRMLRQIAINMGWI